MHGYRCMNVYIYMCVCVCVFIYGCVRISIARMYNYVCTYFSLIMCIYRL